MKYAPLFILHRSRHLTPPQKSQPEFSLKVPQIGAKIGKIGHGGLYSGSGQCGPEMLPGLTLEGARGRVSGSPPSSPPQCTSAPLIHLIFKHLPLNLHNALTILPLKPIVCMLLMFGLLCMNEAPKSWDVPGKGGGITS